MTMFTGYTMTDIPEFNEEFTMMTPVNYRAYPAVAQSDLKACDKNSYVFNATQQYTRLTIPPYFVLGSYIDFKLTQDILELNDEFYLSNLTKIPSGKGREIVDAFYHTNNAYILKYSDVEKPTHLPMLDASLKRIMDDFEYYPTREFDSKKGTLLKINGPYLRQLIDADGRTIVSKEQQEIADIVVYNFKNSDKTGVIFDSPYYESIYQVPLCWIEEGMMCKGLPDVVLIDREERTLTLVDIKTTAISMDRFKTHEIRSKGYHIQAAYYLSGLQHLVNGTLVNQEYFKGLDVQGYTVKDSFLAVESTTNPGRPELMKLGPTLLYEGKHGVMRKLDVDLRTVPAVMRPHYRALKRQYKKRGYLQMLLNYKEHSETNQWEYRPDIYNAFQSQHKLKYIVVS